MNKTSRKSDTDLITSAFAQFTEQTKITLLPFDLQTLQDQAKFVFVNPGNETFNILEALDGELTIWLILLRDFLLAMPVQKDREKGHVNTLSHHLIHTDLGRMQQVGVKEHADAIELKDVGAKWELFTPTLTFRELRETLYADVYPSQRGSNHFSIAPQVRLWGKDEPIQFSPHLKHMTRRICVGELVRKLQKKQARAKQRRSTEPLVKKAV